jgi:hypothetical protein
VRKDPTVRVNAPVAQHLAVSLRLTRQVHLDFGASPQALWAAKPTHKDKA